MPRPTRKEKEARAGNGLTGEQYVSAAAWRDARLDRFVPQSSRRDSCSLARLVWQVLRVVIGLLPQHLAGCRPELPACRQRLASDAALVALRSLAAPWLPVLPAPLGFRSDRSAAGHPERKIHQAALVTCSSRRRNAATFRRR